MFDKKMNRGLAVTFESSDNEQGKLNRAKDFLETPPQNITEDINCLAQLNKIVQEYGDSPITVENVVEYCSIIEQGYLLAKEDSQPLRKAIPNLHIFLKRLSQDLQLKTNMNVMAQSFKDWEDILRTVGHACTDAEFRALVTRAINNLPMKDGNQQLVQELTLTVWINSGKEMGQTKFFDEVTTMFIKEVANAFNNNEQGKPPISNRIWTVFDRFYKTLDTHGERIFEMTKKKESLQVIFRKLLNALQERPNFQEAFEQAGETQFEFCHFFSLL